MGLSGLCGFDFMQEANTGKAYLIEINPRATQVGHLTLGGGRDLPAALYGAVTGQPIRRSAGRYGEPCHRAFSARVGQRSAKRIPPHRISRCSLGHARTGSCLHPPEPPAELVVFPRRPEPRGGFGGGSHESPGGEQHRNRGGCEMSNNSLPSRRARGVLRSVGSTAVYKAGLGIAVSSWERT